MMVELTKAEHLVHFMATRLSLSRNDSKFMNSLYRLDKVTTNQLKLFNKLIYKYQRQLAKHELDCDQLVGLPWEKEIVSSDPEFTDAYAGVKDDILWFRCPFNRNFLKEFRLLDEQHEFKWNLENKRLEAKLGTYTLKMLISTAINHFKNMHLSTEIKSMIDDVSRFSDAKYWAPTLVRAGSNLFIAACNEALHESLGDIKLSLDPKTVNILLFYGVEIDSSLYDIDDPRARFIHNRVIKHEISDLVNMLDWLKESGADMLLFNDTYTNRKEFKELSKMLQTTNITSLVGGSAMAPLQQQDIAQYNIPMVVKFRSTNNDEELGKVAKVVYLVNSTPITIK